MALDAFMTFTPKKSVAGDVEIEGETTDAIASKKAEAGTFEINDFKWGASAVGKTAQDKPVTEVTTKDKDGNVVTKTEKPKPGPLSNLAARSISVDTFSISKPFDTASLGLFRGCTIEKCYWAKAQVLFRKFGEAGANGEAEPFVYLTFEFENVRIDKIDWKLAANDGGDKPDQEDVDFSFEKCTIYYTPQTDSGEKMYRSKNNAMKTATWSRPTGKPDAG